MIPPIVVIVERNRDQRQSVSLSRTDKRSAGRLCESRLDSDGTVIGLQKLVVVDEKPPALVSVVSYLVSVCRRDLAKRFVFQCIRSELTELNCSRVVCFTRKPMRIFKMCVNKSERTRLLVHLFDESCLRTRTMYRK